MILSAKCLRSAHHAVRTVVGSSTESTSIRLIASRAVLPSSPNTTTVDVIKKPIGDDKLLRRGDFHGVVSKRDQRSKDVRRSPEIELSRMQEFMRKMSRVKGENVYSILERLEAGEGSMVSTLRKAPDRWLPMLIESCGYAMSNLPRKTREILLSRLWKQIEKHDMPVSLKTYNSYLQVLIENDTVWDASDELAKMLKRGLEPDQASFSHLLGRLANLGDDEGCKRMVYTMASHGCVVDAKINSLLVYCFALRGHHAKADSLTNQAETKYNDEAFRDATGACARAAAARGDLNRLREVLRRSMITTILEGGTPRRKLGITRADAFETAWKLSINNRHNYGLDSVMMISQILGSIDRSAGFFRGLIREADRHIAEEHYYTAIAFIEDTIKVSDCLQNQGSVRIFEEIFARMSRQLVLNRVAVDTVKNIADRIVRIETRLQLSVMYANLMFDSMMLKELTLDERMAYLTAFVDTVDLNRERPHIILPLLVLSENIDDRLRVLFRCNNIGYKDITQLDAGILIKYVLQPLNDTQRGRTNIMPLDGAAKILKSFGSSDEMIWTVFHSWYKQKEIEEAKFVASSVDDSPPRPNLNDLKGWLRNNHERIFGSPKKIALLPKNTHAKLMELVDSRSSDKISALLAAQGWPQDTNFNEIVPLILELYLENEDWPSTRKMLQSLASQLSKYRETTVEEDKPTCSPVTNVHLISILRSYCEKSGTSNADTVKGLTDTAYELSRLFPNATSDQHDTFFSISREYRKLFGSCLGRFSQLTTRDIDSCIELLRTLVKLNIIHLIGNEKVTCQFLEHVLNKVGWDEALVTWLKLQSTFSSPNGIYALFMRCLKNKDDVLNKTRVQYVMHRARSFMSESQLYALYAAVLVKCNKLDEATKVVVERKDTMTANHTLHMMRLVNALSFPVLDEVFMLAYPTMCLEHSALLTDEASAVGMLQHCLQVLEYNSKWALALKTYDLFKQRGIDPEEEWKLRLWRMVNKQEKLHEQWTYAPKGLLRITADDDIIKQKNADVSPIREALKAEVDLIMS